MAESALITPPVGVNVFIIAGIAPDVPLEDVFKGVFAFFLMDMLTVAILVAFPIISTYIPNTMLY
jgi:TRAP-type C4-dicarboxylate transport system permease large subunit